MYSEARGSVLSNLAISRGAKGDPPHPGPATQAGFHWSNPPPSVRLMSRVPAINYPHLSVLEVCEDDC